MSLVSSAGSPRRQSVRRAIAIVGTYVLTAFAALTLGFALPRLLPGDPLAVAVADDNGGTTSAEAREALTQHYGLNRPVSEQYVVFIKGVSSGDLGWSISRRAPVTDVVRARLPGTLTLVLPAMLIASVVGFVAGIESAWRRAGVLDRAALLAASVLRGIPEYAVGIGLVLAFAVLVPVFPLSGAQTPFLRDASAFGVLGDLAWHAVLPVTTLTLGLLSVKFLTARAATIGVLGQEYLQLARAKGLRAARIKYSHAAPNMAAPFLSQLGAQFGFAIGGSLFVEQIFAYPALGSLLRDAVETRDYPLVDGCFLVLAATVLVVNLLTELLVERFQPERAS